MTGHDGLRSTPIYLDHGHRAHTTVDTVRAAVARARAALRLPLGRWTTADDLSRAAGRITNAANGNGPDVSG
ncbi:hypothetical protein E1181_15815 [Saccharopolyspora terrae]|uniref:Uncharacterized protein n=1 Tax=Saccharopolyspora terrae TaxID=2530384 RepID=A0A4R4VHN0_9PSEU|nr:hypothetical protein [Saccharopolyspora terrae]TDD05169.1 hypothetical protein E1181_15815 [Saccharopolyspora terrae]